MGTCDLPNMYTNLTYKKCLLFLLLFCILINAFFVHTKNSKVNNLCFIIITILKLLTEVLQVLRRNYLYAQSINLTHNFLANWPVIIHSNSQKCFTLHRRWSDEANKQMNPNKLWHFTGENNIAETSTHGSSTLAKLLLTILRLKQ